MCSFQDAHYQVSVYRAGSSDPMYEGEPQSINHSDHMVEAEITSMFQANSPYYAIVTFATHFKHISANISFSKCWALIVLLVLLEQYIDIPARPVGGQYYGISFPKLFSSNNTSSKHVFSVIKA